MFYYMKLLAEGIFSSAFVIVFAVYRAGRSHSSVISDVVRFLKHGCDKVVHWKNVLIQFSL